MDISSDSSFLIRFMVYEFYIFKNVVHIDRGIDRDDFGFDFDLDFFRFFDFCDFSLVDNPGECFGLILLDKEVLDDLSDEERFFFLAAIVLDGLLSRMEILDDDALVSLWFDGDGIFEYAPSDGDFFSFDFFALETCTFASHAFERDRSLDFGSSSVAWLSTFAFVRDFLISFFFEAFTFPFIALLVFLGFLLFLLFVVFLDFLIFLNVFSVALSEDEEEESDSEDKGDSKLSWMWEESLDIRFDEESCPFLLCPFSFFFLMR